MFEFLLLFLFFWWLFNRNEKRKNKRRSFFKPSVDQELKEGAADKPKLVLPTSVKGIEE